MNLLYIDHHADSKKGIESLCNEIHIPETNMFDITKLTCDQIMAK